MGADLSTNAQEDAATAEIARVQLWQWCKYGSKTVSCPRPAISPSPELT